MSTAKTKVPTAKKEVLTDAFTGVDFTPRSRNHYETNSGIPVAPPVDLPRPTLRQRIENLINRGHDPLADFMRQSQEQDTYDFDVPDDPDAPLTPSEANYVESIASELAEQAPLPDEGLPRPDELQPTAASSKPAEQVASSRPGSESPAPPPAPAGKP